MGYHQRIRSLRGDLFGGLTAGVVAIPLALAFGVASGLGPMAGIYGAVGCGIIAAILGGTPVQVSGPTGPMTVVAATVIAGNTSASGDPDLAVVFGTFVLAGVFESLMGVMRLGQYIRYIPYPVVSGFMTGIGVIILVLQVFPFFGMESPSSKPIEILGSLGQLTKGANPMAAALALLTVVLIYLLPRLTKAIPSPLAALALGSIVAGWLRMEVPVIGEIPSGLPSLQAISMAPADLIRMIVPAIELAMLGAIDSLLTSLVADQITRSSHDSDRELIGQGVGNIVAGLIGGIPGAGATMRTVVNVNAGGTTRLSGVFHGLLLTGVIIGGADLVRYIPLPVLAGILFTVGIGIIDRRGLRHLLIVPKSDAVIKVLVLAVTVLHDLITAVAIGSILACLAFMKKIADISERETRVSELSDEPWSDEADIPESIRGSVFIKHVQGPLFFGFVSGFRRMAERMSSGKLVIFRMDQVNYMDQTGIYALDETINAFENRGVRVLLCGLRGQHVELARRMGIIPRLVAEPEVFASFEQLKQALPEILRATARYGREGAAAAD